MNGFLKDITYARSGEYILSIYTRESCKDLWKMAAHASFDPLWKTGPFRGRRKAAYGWLAGQMGLPVEKTHIGMFDVPQCQEVIKIIEKGDFKNAQL